MREQLAAEGGPHAALEQTYTAACYEHDRELE